MTTIISQLGLTTNTATSAPNRTKCAALNEYNTVTFALSAA
jgi:hypothetical protein